MDYKGVSPLWYQPDVSLCSFIARPTSKVRVHIQRILRKVRRTGPGALHCASSTHEVPISSCETSHWITNLNSTVTWSAQKISGWPRAPVGWRAEPFTRCSPTITNGAGGRSESLISRWELRYVAFVSPHTFFFRWLAIYIGELRFFLVLSPCSTALAQQHRLRQIGKPEVSLAPWDRPGLQDGWYCYCH